VSPASGLPARIGRHREDTGILVTSPLVTATYKGHTPRRRGLSVAPVVGCPSRFHRLRSALQPLGVLLIAILVIESWTFLVMRDADTAWALPVIGGAAVAGLILVGRSTWRLLEDERHLNPAITARYRTLANLLDQPETMIIPPGDTALLLLPQASGGREVLRFDRAEFTSTLALGIGDTVVYERFLLSPTRPVVFHHFSAMTVPPQRHHDKVDPHTGETPALPDNLAGLVELSRRTGVDLATAADLDGLIAQLRAFQAARA
jgi:hypothetical protein